MPQTPEYHFVAPVGPWVRRYFFQLTIGTILFFTAIVLLSRYVFDDSDFVLPGAILCGTLHLVGWIGYYPHIHSQDSFEIHLTPEMLQFVSPVAAAGFGESFEIATAAVRSVELRRRRRNLPAFIELTNDAAETHRMTWERWDVVVKAAQTIADLRPDLEFDRSWIE